MSGRRRFLVTSHHATTGDLVAATSPEEAAKQAFGRKKLSGLPGGIEMGRENFVTVYELGASYEFYPEIEYQLIGVKEKP